MADLPDEPMVLGLRHPGPWQAKAPGHRSTTTSWAEMVGSSIDARMKARLAGTALENAVARG